MARQRTRTDTIPLIEEEGGIPAKPKTKPLWKPTPGHDWDPDLPYGGKVYLARKLKEDPTWIKIGEAALLIGTFLFALYAYFYFENLHFHVTHGYAHLGFPQAQHLVGQRFLHGVGTDKDHHTAMEWFKKAADQGHPHASYNLAVGHLKGLRTDILKKGEPHTLIKHAASEGVKEADHVLNNICTRGGCE